MRSKLDVRRQVSARRRERPAAERTDAARALAVAVLALPETASAGTVAAYVSRPGEPGTAPLRAALRRRGVRVLVPVLLADRDLDWVEDGLPADETVGEPLGAGAVASADVVVCPATAVDATGTRLGKGGGSYDRALPRRRARALVIALVHDDELFDTLPAELHDVAMDAAVTPTRTLRFTAPPRPARPAG